MSAVSRRLFILDDEVDCMSVFTMILRDEGYLVDAYYDPTLALSAFKPQYYDLIIVDYRMADINGIAFIQEIRKLDSSVKAILITAWQPQTIGHDLQNWFSRVLLKPVTGEKLVEEVRAALKEDRTNPDTVLAIPNSLSYELESLGIKVSRLNELNDKYEIQHLIDNLKQMFYQNYKSSLVFTD
jgi:two-component system response regulator FixJ